MAAASALLAASVLLGAAATPGGAQSSRRPQARLADIHERWFAEAEPLLTEEEAGAFERLAGPGARERFLRAFWQARPPRLLERWRENREARDQLRERSPAMERAVLLAGKPAFRQTVEPCESTLRRIEIWTWDGWRLEHQLSRAPPPGEDEVVLVFVQQVNFDPRSARLWAPGAGVDLTFAHDPTEGRKEGRATPPAGALRVLDQAARRRCLTPAERRRLERRLEQAVDWPEFIERLGWTAGARDSATRPADWIERFLRVEAVLDPGSMAVPGVSLDFDALGSENRRTTIRGRLLLPAEHLTVGGGQILDRVTITGDIFLGRRLADSFVVTHHVTGGVPIDQDTAGASDVALDFYRRLPPGAYRIELRAEDRLGRGLLRTSRSLTVPTLDRPPALPNLALLSRRETIVLNQLPSVELLAPESRVLGSTFSARIAATPGIAGVTFLRDGRTVATADAPPFVRTLDLPARRHRIEVRGHDAQGALVARHALDIEREERPFSVALERPEPALAAQALDLSVRVDVPAGRELDRVDCYQDAALLDSMAIPPFRCRVPAGLRLPLSFVRAAATLRSGEQVEDIAFLGSDAPEQIDVRLVDLLVSVGGPRTGPATGLGAADFRVLHRGVEAPIREVRSLTDRPLTVALLMDISSSMGRGVRVAAASAQRFFESILTARDTASLIVFNHDLDRLAPFSGDPRRLRYAAEGLRAWGATRLHDGIAYAVSSFAGRPDRRALVVLSDGADTDSNLDFERVLAQVESGGVVVYPIALRVRDPATTRALQHLAETTGGRSYTAASVEDLDGIYREIETALRSQYLIAFAPPPGVGAQADGLRDIRVEVSGAGLEVTGVRSRGR